MECFQGVIIPLLTPFTAKDEFDEDSFYRLLEYLISGNVKGVLLLGSTGESASIPHRTRFRVVEKATAYISERLKIFVGIGDNCLRQSLDDAQYYWQLGVHAFVAHLPTYYPLSEKEILRFYRSLARETPGPVLLYNIPAAVHMSIPLEIIYELSDEPNIVGIKDSENDPQRFCQLLKMMRKHSDFMCFWGSGKNIPQMVAQGANGFVPTLGNLAPGLCQKMFEHASANQMMEAEALQQEFNKLNDIFGPNHRLGQNYGLIKAALNELDLCEPYMLPPLITPDVHDQDRIKKVFFQWRIKVMQKL